MKVDLHLTDEEWQALDQPMLLVPISSVTLINRDRREERHVLLAENSPPRGKDGPLGAQIKLYLAKEETDGS